MDGLILYLGAVGLSVDRALVRARCFFTMHIGAREGYA